MYMNFDRYNAHIYRDLFIYRSISPKNKKVFEIYDKELEDRAARGLTEAMAGKHRHKKNETADERETRKLEGFPEIPLNCFRNVLENVGDPFAEHEIDVLLEEMRARGIYDEQRRMVRYAA